MGHSHGVPAGSAAARHRRPLVAAFVLTAAFMVVEFAVGVATGSLALLSDAAHMGTDVLALGMSIAAISLAASGAVDLDGLVTARFGLDETERALLAARQDPTALKVIVRPNGTNIE